MVVILETFSIYLIPSLYNSGTDIIVPIIIHLQIIIGTSCKHLQFVN